MCFEMFDGGMFIDKIAKLLTTNLRGKSLFGIDFKTNTSAE